MVLFAYPTFNNNKSFDKDAIVKDIQDQIKKNYADQYFALESPDKSLCDMILIKSVTATIKTAPSPMKLYSQEMEKKLQQVIAVSIIDPNEELPEEDLTTLWTACHLIISDSRTLFRRLKDI